MDKNAKGRGGRRTRTLWNYQNKTQVVKYTKAQREVIGLHSCGNGQTLLWRTKPISSKKDSKKFYNKVRDERLVKSTLKSQKSLLWKAIQKKQNGVSCYMNFKVQEMEKNQMKKAKKEWRWW